LSYYKKNIKPREREIFNIADMAPLSKQFFSKALLDLAPVYEREINAEIEDMTRILDSSKSKHKNFASQ
jgi:hypothetical protein